MFVWHHPRPRVGVGGILYFKKKLFDSNLPNPASKVVYYSHPPPRYGSKRWHTVSPWERCLISFFSGSVIIVLPSNEQRDFGSPWDP